MNLFSRTIALLSLSVFVTACAAAESKDLPFPTVLPSDDVLNSQYQRLNHDLSPLPEYHFHIQIPNGWKTLDTKIETTPDKDDLADVAVFRQSGAWITDPTAPINGEISVSVINVSGSTLSPADWLQNILEKNAKGFTMVDKHLSPSAKGEVPDVLITYVSGADKLVSRMMAFRTGNRMFVITGSDTAKEYPQNAEAFNVAIATFKLDQVTAQ
jgi:hypothetical protein